MHAIVSLEISAAKPAPARPDPGIGFLRRGHRYESAEIGALIESAFAPFLESMPPRAFDAYLGNPGDVLRHWNKSETFVYELHDRIVGAVSFSAGAVDESTGLPTGPAGFRMLVVDPSARGRGIGRILTARCIGEARRAGASALVTYASAAMEPARRLYEKVGFRRSPQHGPGPSMKLDPGAIIAYRLDLGTMLS